MVALLRIGRPPPFRALALFGHSASGKSSVASRLGLRRQDCDYDVVIRDCAGDYEAALRILARPSNGLIILPNNRKILALLDANRGLMRENELRTLEEFRQHVDDLALRHLTDFAPVDQRRFPPGMAQMMKEE